MRRISPIGWFVLLVFSIPVIAYMIYGFYERNLGQLPVLGKSETINGKEVPHYIEDFQMINQEGKMISADSWKNKIVIADFFFTHCPSTCPRMTNNLLKVQHEFSNDSTVRINSFSVDPKDDSAAQLKKYAARFTIDSDKWDLLTGDKKEIYKLARNSFLIVATDGDGGPNDFIHSDRLVLIDKEKRIRGYYDGTDSKEVDLLINDIKKLKDEN